MLLRCLYAEDAYLSVCIISIQFDELIFQFWLPRSASHRSIMSSTLMLSMAYERYEIMLTV